MADTKVSALGSVTPVLTDLAYVVDDPGGTPISGKCTWNDVLTLFKANTDLDDGANVTITSNSSGEILVWNGSAWINQTLAEAGIQAADANTAKYDAVTANFTGTLQNGGSNVVVDTDIGSTVQAYDVDTLKADTSDVLTVGFESTAYDAGTQTTGTFTPAVANGNFQVVTFNGNTALGEPAPSANDTALSMTLLVINGASAASLGVTAFDATGGDTYATTSGNKYLFHIDVFDDGATHYSFLNIVALQ